MLKYTISGYVYHKNIHNFRVRSNLVRAQMTFNIYSLLVLMYINLNQWTPFWPAIYLVSVLFKKKLWPIDTKLAVWVAYIKTQLGILPRCLWSRSRSLLLKLEIQFPLNNFSLLWPIDIKLAVCVAYINMQLGMLPRFLWSRSRSLLLKYEFSFC